MGGYGLEEQIKEAGIHYPGSYDITYRIGYVLQSAGSVGFAVLYGMGSRFFIIPLLIFEAGIVLSSLFLLVWKAEIKRFILRMTFAGIVLQIISIFIHPSSFIPHPFVNAFYSEKIFLLGLGFVLVGGAGIVGKEAYCFGFNEGWLLIVIYPLAILPNILFSSAGHSFNLIISGVIVLLHLSFLRRKLSQPLLKSCEGNVCGSPEDNDR